MHAPVGQEGVQVVARLAHVLVAGRDRTGRGLLANRGRVQLFNIKDDPTESADLAKAQPQRVERMLARWKTWNESNQPPLWSGGRPRPTKDAYQYADYEWLKGTPHYKANE